MKKEDWIKKRGILILIISFLFLSVANALTVSDDSQEDFDNGTYSDTEYNTTFNAVTLIPTGGEYNTSVNGSFTSRIFSTGLANFTNLSWTLNHEELSNNMQTSLMEGNTLLFHFNNDSAYGENSTRVYDFSGNGNNGTASGSGYYFNSSGKLKGSIILNSTADGVTIQEGPGVNISDNISMSFWINPASYGTYYAYQIISKWTSTTNCNYAVYFFGNSSGNEDQGLIRVYANKNGTWRYITDYSYDENQRLYHIPLNTWTHVAWTYSSEIGGQLYINGQPSGYLINWYLGPLATNNSQNAIIRAQNASVDEFGIWNRTLSAEEMEAIYKMGAERLNLSVRTCGFSDCSDSNFTNIGFTDSSYTNTSTIGNYFQYRFEMNTPFEGYTPKLYNVSLGYSSLEGVQFTEDTPLNNSYIQGNSIFIKVAYNNLTNITFNLYNNSGLVNSSFFDSEIRTMNWSNLNGNEEYYYNVSLFDTNNVLLESETRKITLDNTLPIASVDNIANHTNFTTGNISIDLDIDELNFANSTFNLYKNGSFGEIWNTISEYNSWGYLVISDAGDRIAITDWSNNIYILDGEGNQIETIKAPFWPTGIGMNSNGSVIVYAEYDNYPNYMGHIHISKDYGETWEEIEEPREDYEDIAISGDGKTIIAGGDGNEAIGWVGNMYISHDGGETWNLTGPNMTYSWNSFAVSENGSIIAATDYSNAYLFISNDSGETWDLSLTGEGYWWSKIDMSWDGRVIAVGDWNGSIYVSRDYGNTWNKEAFQGGWMGIGVSEDGSKMVAADSGFYPNYQGNIYYSNEAGNWEQASLSTMDWYDADISGEGDKIIVSGSGSSSNNYMDYIYLSLLGNNIINTTTVSGTTSDFVLSDGRYNVESNVCDLASNCDTTDMITFNIDTTPPIINSFYFSPNSTDSVDPLSNITFTADIQDSTIGVSEVILEYYNNSVWANLSMPLVNGSSLNGIYQVNLTLDSSPSNYTFKVFAIDYLNNSVESSEENATADWDCTWIYESSIVENVLGYGETKYLGNIYIENTGDAQYPTKNCSLTFRLTHTLPEGRIYFDGDSLKPTSSYILPAKGDTNITVNATFFSTVGIEDVNLTINELTNTFGITENKSVNISVTLTTSSGGAYLQEEITSAPTLLYLKPQRFAIEGYVRNLAGDETENNTAYNVTLNWSLPNGFYIEYGEQNVSYENLSENNREYNNINISFNRNALLSLSPGEFEISLYAQGYTNNGSEIIPIGSNSSTLVDQTNIVLLCYGTSDKFLVPACGSLDPDNDYSEDEEENNPEGGSTGGGGSKTASEEISSSADLQLVRGKQNEVKVVFENRDKNQSLRDLEFSISGDIAKYVDINPKKLDSLGPKENVTIILTITSPTYIQLGKQRLKITLTAKKKDSDYKDSKTILLEVHEISLTEAGEIMNESINLLKQLDEANLSFDDLNNLLNQSEKALGDFNLETVRDNYKTIKEQVEYALYSKEMINQLNSLINSAEEKGIDISESKRLLQLAQLSMERREFSEAYQRVKDSQMTYAMEVKGEFGDLKYYLDEYPKEIFFGIFFLTLFSVGAGNISKLRAIKKKIRLLKKEEKILDQLIKVIQNDCFKEKKISMQEYQTAMKEYNSRLSNVIEEIIELETKRVNMLRFSSKIKRLKIEKQKIIDLIKEIQEDYLKKRRIETRTYELKMNSFNRRISDIEERLATLETEKALRGFWRKLK
ncbi:MAG: hypothetical protein ACP5NZ_04530 [Nanobdellota archaeon]